MKILHVIEYLKNLLYANMKIRQFLPSGYYGILFFHIIIALTHSPIHIIFLGFQLLYLNYEQNTFDKIQLCIK